MALTLHVPDSVTAALRLPEAEMASRLKVELAVALFGQTILSFGKANELAGIGRHRLAELLEQRGMPRHYGVDELEEDSAYARSPQHG